MPGHPGEAMAALTPLIGVWSADGEILDDRGEEVVQRVSGTDAYEWLGASFVVHRVEVMMGDAEVRQLEMIG
ncbi:MAG: hypothetical protein M3313_02380, partial [Actinomycetota bacterium]|nr:hypothetical protein [Actinomycetota bacterium]